jgi:RNA polymerase sigma-70 factor, ECF subfamily
MTAQRADELVFDGSPVGTPEERELALAFQNGERDAYDRIHDRYAPRVLSVCRRMLGDPDDAQEAAQEAFLRVYQGLPKFNGRFRLGAWIVRIATNVCLDQLRSRNRRPSELAPLEVLDLEYSSPVDDNDPELLFLRHAEGRRVRKVLDSLPPMHRAAIVLRDFEGVSYADIAETLGITECQVKALLHRARRGFKRSWTSVVASMILPTGVFRRLFKRVDLSDGSSGTHLTTASQAAESAMATTQQVATSASTALTSCGAMVQQCSQFVVERAAPVVTAVVVGTASVGVAAVASPERSAKRRDEPAVAFQPAAANAAKDIKEEPKAALSRSPAIEVPKIQPDVTTEEEDPAAEEPVPAAEETPPPPAEEPAAEEPAEPAPEGTPSPEPTESPEDPASGGNSVPQPEPSLAPEPEGFTMSFSTDVAPSGEPCLCDLAPHVVSESLDSNDARGIEYLHQALKGSASFNESQAYPLALTHTSWDGITHEMKVSLTTDGGRYQYEANGLVTNREHTDWGGWRYVYDGTYKLTSKPGGLDKAPDHGTYRAEVMVSWRTDRVVAVHVTLTDHAEGFKKSW